MIEKPEWSRSGFILFPACRVSEALHANWKCLFQPSVTALQFIQHGFHLRQSVLVLCAASAFDALL